MENAGGMNAGWVINIRHQIKVSFNNIDLY